WSCGHEGGARDRPVRARAWARVARGLGDAAHRAVGAVRGGELHVAGAGDHAARRPPAGRVVPISSSGMSHPDSFGARATLDAGGSTHEIFRLDALQQRYDVARLPYSIKILLENLLRFEDGESASAEDAENVAKWVAADEPSP